MEISVNYFKVQLSSNRKWMERGIVAIYSNNQTVDEQSAEVTYYRNGIGFNGADAEILSSFARQLLAGRNLSEKQAAIAFKKMPKYAKQLVALAEGKKTEEKKAEEEIDECQVIVSQDGILGINVDKSLVVGLASEMGIRPGFYPQVLVFEKNGHTSHWNLVEYVRRADGELSFVKYRNDVLEFDLHVYND